MPPTNQTYISSQDSTEKKKIPSFNIINVSLKFQNNYSENEHYENVLITHFFVKRSELSLTYWFWAEISQIKKQYL